MKSTPENIPTLARLLSLSLLAITFNTQNLLAAQAKHIAVPPENISAQKLPAANSKGLFSHSTMLPIDSSNASQERLNATTDLQTINQSIYFDGQPDTPLIFIGPDSENWNLTVIAPNGKQLLNEAKTPTNRLPTQAIQMGQESFKGKQFILSNAVPGQFQVTFSRKQSVTETLSDIKQSQGFLMFKGDPSYKLYSFLDNNLTVQNSNINIVAYMVDAQSDQGKRQQMMQKTPMRASITQAYASVTLPSKKQLTLRLKDDGLNGDKLAGDGLYSAKVPSNEIGIYTSQVQVEGIRPDGIRFSRTATDLYPIEEQTYHFTKSPASLRLTGTTSALISVPVKQQKDSQAIYLAAEVWGTNQKGKPQSAAWVGGVVSPVNTAQGTNLELSFDTRWLSRNKLHAPYALKSLRLQTVNNNVPIAELDRLPLKASKLLFPTQQTNSADSFNKSSGATDLTITADMLMGNAPLSLNSQINISSGPKLLLVHGYCSGNVWNTANFTNSAEFKDYDQNRSHEDFAQRIINFGTPYSSYGIVAHSQGGAAALHLYSRYWSGLDNATGGRIIQSVGTPYQGTALAGNLAVLGEVFGAGCGKNTDLTYSGAANWLSTIPNWARSQVDYYTTSFTTKWWRYDYCHLATDLFLDDPEDGTTEKWSGQLSGAVNKGHKTGWCHTTGMRDTAQYFDSSRNASMNSNAAR
jgi:hypothetical protein